MADNEKLTPEEEDVRNQALLQDLRYIHSPVTKAQSLEHVRNRLLATPHTSTHSAIQTFQQATHKIKQGRIQSMNDMLIPITKKKGQYLNMLTAGVVAVLLIGSLLFVVTHVYQNNTGSGGPMPSAPTAKPTPQPSCDPGSNLTPTPIVTPTPSPTCVPIVTPTPAPTPVPIVTPTPVSTPVPIVKPIPAH